MMYTRCILVPVLKYPVAAMRVVGVIVIYQYDVQFQEMIFYLMSLIPHEAQYMLICWIKLSLTVLVGIVNRHYIMTIFNL